MLARAAGPFKLHTSRCCFRVRIRSSFDSSHSDANIYIFDWKSATGLSVDNEQPAPLYCTEKKLQTEEAARVRCYANREHEPHKKHRDGGRACQAECHGRQPTVCSLATEYSTSSTAVPCFSSLAVDGMPPVISERAGRFPRPRLPNLDRAVPGRGGEEALRHHVPVHARHL